MADRVHKIRLHGTWQAKLIRSDQCSTHLTDGSRQEIEVPGDWSQWLGREFRGLVQYERGFGMPTGLDAGQEIWLVVEQVDYRAKVWLNGNAGIDNDRRTDEQPLGELTLGQSPFRQSIRGLMQARNRLHLEIELPVDAQRGERSGYAGGLIGEVRLEIV